MVVLGLSAHSVDSTWMLRHSSSMVAIPVMKAMKAIAHSVHLIPVRWSSHAPYFHSVFQSVRVNTDKLISWHMHNDCLRISLLLHVTVCSSSWGSVSLVVALGFMFVASHCWKVAWSDSGWCFIRSTASVLWCFSPPCEFAATSCQGYSQRSQGPVDGRADQSDLDPGS